MFVWAKPKGDGRDSLTLSQRVLGKGILLAPGHLFRPKRAPSHWLRFNVVYCDDDRLFRCLDEVLSQGR